MPEEIIKDRFDQGAALGVEAELRVLDPDPARPIEHIAFDELHYSVNSGRQYHHQDTTNLQEFTSDYIKGRTLAGFAEPGALVDQLLQTMYDYAVSLAYKYPDNMEDIDRRLNLWLDVLGPDGLPKDYRFKVENLEALNSSARNMWDKFYKGFHLVRWLTSRLVADEHTRV